MGVVCAQQPLESELLQRCQQLQTRLSTLKIENEEVRHHFLLFIDLLHFPSAATVLFHFSPCPLGEENHGGHSVHHSRHGDRGGL